MKILFGFISSALLIFSSCKKSSTGNVSPNKNEVKATVVISPTSTIMINATGSKAQMGCSSLGGGTFVSGTNPGNAAVYISYVHSTGLSCITSPGAYNFSCE
jgi:hypothetical protein